MSTPSVASLGGERLAGVEHVETFAFGEQLEHRRRRPHGGVTRYLIVGIDPCAVGRVLRAPVPRFSIGRAGGITYEEHATGQEQRGKYSMVDMNLLDAHPTDPAQREGTGDEDERGDRHRLLTEHRLARNVSDHVEHLQRNDRQEVTRCQHRQEHHGREQRDEQIEVLFAGEPAEHVEGMHQHAPRHRSR